MNEQHPERESIWSIGRKWLPWYLASVFVLTVGWTVFTAWRVANTGNHAGAADFVDAMVRGASPAASLIPLYALVLITALDTAGGATVVTYRYLNNKFLKPQRERMQKEAREKGIEQGREEGREQGREEGREQGREEGREDRQRQWVAWNQRRVQAEQNDEPFNEPPPGSNDNGNQAR